MHGDNDTLIVPSEAKLNHNNAGSRNKILSILKGVGHNDMMMAHGNHYFKSLGSFFNSIFP